MGASVTCMGARKHGQEGAQFSLDNVQARLASITTFWFTQKRSKSLPPATFHRLNFKLHLNASEARALSRTPLGELTSLPRSLAGLKEGLLCGGRKGRGGARRRGKRGGEEKGRGNNDLKERGEEEGEKRKGLDFSHCKNSAGAHVTGRMRVRMYEPGVTLSYYDLSMMALSTELGLNCHKRSGS